MAIRKENRTQPAKEFEVVAETICEMCGAEQKDDASTDHGNGWSKEPYGHDRILVQRQVGTHYPEGGETEYTIADICPNCWKGKVVPWLESQGVKFRTKNVDY